MRVDEAGAHSVGGAARFFDAVAGRYDRVYALPAAESRRRMRRLRQELPSPPATILDLGVGTGRELSALLDAGYRPTGLDASEAMLARCARRSRSVPLVKADFWQALPFADASFDAAIALHGSLAHGPDIASLGRLSRELARVVREGGTWIAEAPAPAWLEKAKASPVQAGGRVRAIGARSCVYEDLVVGESIGVRVLDDHEWREAIGEAWATRVEPLGATEWLVVATRAN
jgi:ubiquinone/menaquinone biosynthesis C-methylase UbiE